MEWKVGLANGFEGVCKACSSTSHLNEAVVVSAIEKCSLSQYSVKHILKAHKLKPFVHFTPCYYDILALVQYN